MQALREITVWAGPDQPNHTYLMDGDKAVAYLKFHTGQPLYFKTPIRLDKRGRKFEKVDDMAFLFGDKSEPTTIEVQGSKGAVYYVDPETKTCTCPGFSFRGHCKHIEEHCK